MEKKGFKGWMKVVLSVVVKYVLLSVLAIAIMVLWHVCNPLYAAMLGGAVLIYIIFDGMDERDWDRKHRR